jgi:hypothetical protein
MCPRSLLHRAGLWSTNGKPKVTGWATTRRDLSSLKMLPDNLEVLSDECLSKTNKIVKFTISSTYPPSVWDTTDTAHCCLYSRVPTRTRLSNPALEDQWRSRIPQKTALMKSRRRLQRISAGISLIILSLGFSLLGLLSLVNKPHADLANVPCAGAASWIAGSASACWRARHSWSLPVFIGDGTLRGWPELNRSGFPAIGLSVRKRPFAPIHQRLLFPGRR